MGRMLDALGVEHNLPTVQEHPVGDALLELTQFNGARGADSLARLVYDAVAPTSSVAAAALYNGICEAGQNVAQHSRQAHGFLAAQRTYGGRLLRFAVADSGIGVLATLQHLGVTSDEEALRHAITPGVSEVGGVGRGMGLSDMREQLVQMRGGLMLASGRSLLLADGSTSTARLTDLPHTYPGTSLQGWLWCDN